MIKKAGVFIWLALLFSGFQTIDYNELKTSDLPIKSETDETCTENKVFNFQTFLKNLYKEIDFGSNPPSFIVFSKTLSGFHYLELNQRLQNSTVVSFIDFSLPSTSKRLWTIDLKSKTVLFNDFVAHGMGTGEDMARKFSDISGSYQSSLGFYITGEVYRGKHDYSLRLHGLEKRFNGNAFDRGIVIHGADYVSEKFISGNKRLGRSQGCPAVSNEISKSFIDTVKDGTILFIYYPDKNYLGKSQILNHPTIQNFS